MGDGVIRDMSRLYVAIISWSLLLSLLPLPPMLPYSPTPLLPHSSLYLPLGYSEACASVAAAMKTIASTAKI